MTVDVTTDLRTERQIAADILLKLIVEGFVRQSSKQSAAAALGLNYDDMEAARVRQRAGGYRPPGGAAPVSRAKKAVGHTARVARAHPAPGVRHCAGPCGRDLPEDHFNWKDQAKGYRKSYCQLCDRAIARNRYLSVGRESQLTAAGLRFEVHEGDDVGDLVCLHCGHQIVVGDRVILNVGVYHESVCP